MVKMVIHKIKDSLNVIFLPKGHVTPPFSPSCSFCLLHFLVPHQEPRLELDSCKILLGTTLDLSEAFPR